jgi:putative hydrolase of the HAD superfamily
MLGRFGLLERFAFILTRNDVRAGKPDPEIYQTSCDRLGVEPGRAVVFEDSVAGTQSARRAGCYVVALRHPLTMGLEFEHAHLVVDSHADELVGRTLGIA